MTRHNLWCLKSRQICMKNPAHLQMHEWLILKFLFCFCTCCFSCQASSVKIHVNELKRSVSDKRTPLKSFLTCSLYLPSVRALFMSTWNLDAFLSYTTRARCCDPAGVCGGHHQRSRPLCNIHPVLCGWHDWSTFKSETVDSQWGWLHWLMLHTLQCFL